jgi:hypothetical protein
VRRLDALGLEWDPHESAWRASLAKLATYRARYGDCSVPHGWMRDPAPGFWVAQQRQRSRQGRLEPERARELNRLGFEWGPRASA